MARIRTDVMRLAEDWRQVLADDPNNARPIVSALLIGRVTIKPTAPRLLVPVYLRQAERSVCFLAEPSIPEQAASTP